MNNKLKVFSNSRMTRMVACVVAAMLVVILTIHRVEAAGGDLDISFGTGGVVTTDLGNYEEACAVAVQKDGRIVIGVKRVYISTSDFILMRYNTDGTADLSFGIGGVVQTQFLGLGGNVSSIQIDSKGRIVAAGTINIDSPPSPYTPHSDFALARYTASGALDTSFGSQGKVIRDYSGYDEGREMAIQKDGKIVVAGFSSGDFALFRLTATGAQDPTFAFGNVVLTDFNDTRDSVHAIALQSDGRIVVGGEASALDNTGHTLSSEFVLARYNSNGSLDTTFGEGGKVTAPISETFKICFGLLVRSVLLGGEQIIAVGTKTNLPYSPDYSDEFVMVCYRSNGSLNPSFGTGGIVFTDFPGLYAGARCVVQQPDGKIIVAGNGSTFFALARYNENGTLDRSFGNDGRVTTQTGDDAQTARIEALALTSQAEIIAAGKTLSATTLEDIALAKYLP